MSESTVAAEAAPQQEQQSGPGLLSGRLVDGPVVPDPVKDSGQTHNDGYVLEPGQLKGWSE